ncbi:MAG: hypothetical protein M0010_21820 [Actinomycetota bacterium]|nr:hypothetical protein [Actinomycetota bacterium]
MILGRLVFGWLDANFSNDDYDLIVANPTHESRLVRHTELILAAASREDQLGEWHFAPEALVKMAETSKSANGSWRAKWDAAQELYDVVHPADALDLRGAKVLVVDDVTTTLAQLHVVGNILKRAGAAEVDGLVIARQVRR